MQTHALNLNETLMVRFCVLCEKETRPAAVVYFLLFYIHTETLTSSDLVEWAEIEARMSAFPAHNKSYQNHVIFLYFTFFLKAPIEIHYSFQ